MLTPFLAACVWVAPATQPTMPKMQVLARVDIGPAVKQLREAISSDIEADDLRAALRPAAALLDGRPTAAERVRTLADDAKADTVTLRQQAAGLIDDLLFEPTQDANTPRGWPPFTPPGEIELKSYPLYRMAEVSNDKRLPQGFAFMTLFGHIQRNDIDMTAPVEMEMDKANDVFAPRTMAFLYKTADIGRVGADGKVTVRDVPPRLAVTVGLRGETDPTACAEAATRIEAWLTQHKADYAPEGPIRLMGYNAPSTPSARKYYEIQQVVKPVAR